MAHASAVQTSWPDFIERLAESRIAHGPKAGLRLLATDVSIRALALLFPQWSQEAVRDADVVHRDAKAFEHVLRQATGMVMPDAVESVVPQFLDRLATVHATLRQDAQAIFAGDPAAESIDEVILAYPGFLAIAIHRIAHELYDLKVPILPRMLSEWAHGETGIDIHPGAEIGVSFAIDHGTGVVIGETTKIGDRVRIYQGVTLGALAVAKRLARRKRHPTIGNDVVIYANATILGGATVVGDGSIIGGNVWLTSSVPVQSVVQFSSRVEQRSTHLDDGLEFHI